MEGVMDSKKIEVLNVKKLKNVNVSRQSIYNFIIEDENFNNLFTNKINNFIYI